MFSRFFIDRPIFAAVLSITITLGGTISVFGLPLAQFPRITPPTVAVTAVYPGASARDVAEAVAAGCGAGELALAAWTNTSEALFCTGTCLNNGRWLRAGHSFDKGVSKFAVRGELVDRILGKGTHLIDMAVHAGRCAKP